MKMAFTRPNQIGGVTVVVPTDESGMPAGPATLCGIMEEGNAVPLFAYDKETENYDPAKFIGMIPDEVIAEKRIKDLIWYGRILI